MSQTFAFTLLQFDMTSPFSYLIYIKFHHLLWSNVDPTISYVP